MLVWHIETDATFVLGTDSEDEQERITEDVRILGSPHHDLMARSANHHLLDGVYGVYLTFHDG